LTYDIAVLNGTVFDGTGADGVRANVGIEGGTICYVGPEKIAATSQIDAQGKVVCPGFIDMHTHNDLRLFLREPLRILEGITTEVIGNCGFSAFPSPSNRHSLIRSFAEPLLGGYTIDWPWVTAEEYIDALSSSKPLVDPVLLVGHGTLRLAICGEHAYEHGVTSENLALMCDKLDTCLKTPSVHGLSLGLEYPPGSYADTAELVALAEVVAKHGGLVAVHLRDQYRGLLVSLDEMFDVVRATGVRCQVSHLQSCQGPEKVPIRQALDRIHTARANGCDISFDLYPYLAGSTVLTYLLPQWMMQGGVPKMLSRIRSTQDRNRALVELRDRPKTPWDKVVLTSFPGVGNHDMLGSDLASLAMHRRVSPELFLLELLEMSKGAGNIITFNKEEKDVQAVFQDPLACIGSDAVWADGIPHPRYTASFSRFLARYVIQGEMMSLQEGIRRCTYLPASILGLKTIGKIATGYRANTVVFSPKALADRATYTDPCASSRGIQHVILGGQHVVADGHMRHHGSEKFYC